MHSQNTGKQLIARSVSKITNRVGP